MPFTIDDKRRYAAWLEMPAHTRRAGRLPESKEQYAKQNNVNSRTLRRWEDEDGFEELRAEERANWDGVDVPALPAPAADDQDAAKADYEAIRRGIVQKALEGDPKAMTEFMKHWGSTFVAEEMNQRNRGLSELDDESLVSDTLALIGRERVEAWLVATAR